MTPSIKATIWLGGALSVGAGLFLLIWRWPLVGLIVSALVFVACLWIGLYWSYGGQRIPFFRRRDP